MTNGYTNEISGNKILVRYSYIGTNYHGSAYQKGVDTVESHLINALTKSGLIVDIYNCDYCKCSRTDKGVHARANYISLFALNNIPKLHLMNINRLNKYLPNDICITKIFPVHSTFSCRYDCKGRIYKYFFNSTNLKICEMAEAAQLFIGEHDFKLFSKRNRGLTKSTIKEITEFQIAAFASGLHVATIKARSFLWHQVRCMMGALIMIGSGQLTMQQLSDMLKLKSNVKCYLMAPADGLLLYDCLFDNIDPMEGDVTYFQDYFNRMNILHSVVNFIANGTNNDEINKDDRKLTLNI